MSTNPPPAPAVPDDLRSGSAVRSGARAMLPLVAAYIPFALVIGAAAAEHGGPLAAWAGSLLIFGGSAHLAAIRTLDTAGPVAAIVTGLLVNARLLVYSASLARRWSGQPRWFRVLGAALIVDPTWVAAERHADEGPELREQRGYFFGAGLALGAGWSTAIAAGALMGARLDSLHLDIAVPLCLLGLVGAGLRAAGARAVIIVAAAVALITASWPAGTGLLAAVAAGSVAGSVLERRSAP